MNEVTPGLVSIVVPVFNVEQYLDACLESIRCQTYPNLQIIIVEDCATDGSLAVAEGHLVDPRVEILRHRRNRGLSAARNTGITAAKGEFVMFVDSDDIIAHTLVEICLEEMHRENLDVVLYSYTAFDDGTNPQGNPEDCAIFHASRFTGYSYFEYPHFAWLKMIRTEILDDERLRFPEGVNYEDWPFHWYLGLRVDKIGHIDQSLVNYRLRKTSITGTGDRKIFDMYTSNLLVAEIVDNQDPGTDVRKVLSDKLGGTAWYVIRTIEGRYLREAITLTRNYEVATRQFRYAYKEKMKISILFAMIALPIPFSVIACRFIRFTLIAVYKCRNFMAVSRKEQGA